ncbi:MAG: hypothetical protein CL563_06835 [Alphaproteobacteria bacterium]|nr:hypothetical protein [Alphaproteobacteria bacterium]
MRQGPNKNRMRGRGHGRKSGNSRNQSFESNGPDVKVRGNAQQVVEKYLTLARDASSAGDRINAESYYQFAEHYYRVMTAANELQRQQQQKHSETDNENSSDGEISAKVEAAENDGSSQNSRRRRNGRGNGAAKEAAQKSTEDEVSSEAVAEEDAGESANV